MKIQKQLPQYEKEKILLIVLAKQSGVFYKASNGHLEKIEVIEEPTPLYSDKEGFFASRGKGKTFQSGSVPAYETKDAYIRKNFEKRIAETLKRIIKKEKIDGIYIFSPYFNLERAEKSFMAGNKRLIRGAFKGNFIRLHPFKLLYKIKEQEK